MSDNARARDVASDLPEDYKPLINNVEAPAHQSLSKEQLAEVAALAESSHDHAKSSSGTSTFGSGATGFGSGALGGGAHGSHGGNSGSLADTLSPTGGQSGQYNDTNRGGLSGAGHSSGTGYGSSGTEGTRQAAGTGLGSSDRDTTHEKKSGGLLDKILPGRGDKDKNHEHSHSHGSRQAGDLNAARDGLTGAPEVAREHGGYKHEGSGLHSNRGLDSAAGRDNKTDIVGSQALHSGGGQDYNNSSNTSSHTGRNAGLAGGAGLGAAGLGAAGLASGHQGHGRTEQQAIADLQGGGSNYESNTGNNYGSNTGIGSDSRSSGYGSGAGASAVGTGAGLAGVGAAAGSHSGSGSHGLGGSGGNNIGKLQGETVGSHGAGGGDRGAMDQPQYATPLTEELERRAQKAGVSSLIIT